MILPDLDVFCLSTSHGSGFSQHTPFSLDTVLFCLLYSVVYCTCHVRNIFGKGKILICRLVLTIIY